MTKYEYLLEKQATGELSILLQVGLPVNILSQMDIYAFHLAHPHLSQWQVAVRFDTCKAVVWQAYTNMSQNLLS